jgi:hypothetical protein
MGSGMGLNEWLRIELGIKLIRLPLGKIDSSRLVE